jgi:hypothetical protein
VFAEGRQIMDDFDIAANGGGRTAISRSFNVNVTGGELNLRFANVLDNAILSAVEVLPIGDTVAPAVPRRPARSGRRRASTSTGTTTSSRTSPGTTSTAATRRPTSTRS